MKKTLSVQVFLAVLLVLSTVLTPASVQAQLPPPPHDDLNSSTAVQEATITYETAPQLPAGPRAPSTEDILLIQTSDPWERSDHYIGNNWYDGITSDTRVLDSLGYSYRVATWNDINSGVVNIFAYPVVLIVNDQVQAFYDSYAAHLADFESFVSSGHTLLFFAAGYGWANGKLKAALPGGTAWNLSGGADLANRNVVANTTHPIVTAQLSDKVALTDGDLFSNYCSHGWFSQLPAGTDVILRESASEGGSPTLIEYRLGNGRVIASTLTWEHNWSYHTGSDEYGTFARKALDDVFLYALSGGTVPADAKLELRIEDAPGWFAVNKSRGSYIDVVARVSGDAAYEVNVTLKTPGNKFGAPAKTFTRAHPGDPAYGQENQYADLGGGEYKITATLQLLAGQYYRELIWRFKIPDGAVPEKDIEMSAVIVIPGHTVQVPTSQAKLNIIEYAQSILVTNRALLFRKYQPDPAQNDVSALLEDVYVQAWAYDGEVFYVDLYNDAARDWNQNVDYSSEEKANAVSVAVDGLVDGWYNRLTKHPSWWETLKPEYLLIIGGDEIIPFYRADDRPYGDLESKIYIDNDDPVGKVPQQHYLLSDNIYADVGGGKSEWEEGKLELSTGRIIGHSAAAMRQFIENAWLKTPPLTQAVMASRSDSHNLDTVRERLNSRNVQVYGEKDPDLTENDSWTRQQWLTALEQPYQVLAYQGHGAYDGWYGTDNWKGGATASAQPAGKIDENHPLFAVEACNFAIPTDLDGAAWNPEPDDNISYKLVSLGAGGILGSTAIDTTAGGDQIAYGERLHNDYFKYLIDTSSWFGLVSASNYSERFGTALLKAKQNYPGNGFPWGYNGIDKKTMLEYVYYGLPWSFVKTPDNQAVQALAAQQAPNGYSFSAEAPQAAAPDAYSQVFTATVASYQFVPTAGFELLDIPGSDILYSALKPVLPVLYKTFYLPPGAAVSGLELLGEHASSLGQHSLPAADPTSSYNPTTGYTSTMDVTGLYPPVRYGYEARDLGDRVEVRITAVPATFNISTGEVMLYDSTVLRVNYTAASPAALGPLQLNAPEYQVAETITATAVAENVGASPVTLTAKATVYDAGGTLLGTASSSPFTAPSGSATPVQVPWTAVLEPGSYRMVLSLEQGGVPQVATSASFNVLAGRVSAFSVPRLIASNGYGTFELAFDNYQAAGVNATARVYVYNSAGVEVVNLLQRTFTVGAGASGNTSWYWTPSGLPVGAYTVRAVVQVGEETYTSGLNSMAVGEAKTVYLPVVSRTYQGTRSYNWLDASNGGTVVAVGDEAYDYVALPFSFNFYGSVYSGVYVSSNGYVSFGSGSTYYNNTCIPSTATPNNAIYAFWDDLSPSGGSYGNVYVKQVDSGTFVIEWHRVKRLSSSDYETFEIILRRDHSITLQYLSLSNAGSATVGVENANGTLAKQYICNGAGEPLANEMALWYATP